MALLTFVIAAPPCLLGLHILVLFCLAVLSRKEMAQATSRKPPDGVDPPELTVLIPAHNEEKLIASTVGTVLACSYPADRLNVLVVADNCDDATADRARRAGAECVERHDPSHQGKGYALDFGLAHLKTQDPPRAVLMLDADSTPNRDYLQRMAQALLDGKRVIQGCYDVAQPDRTWFTRLTHLGFILKSRWQYPGLSRLGLSVPLRGSGMCFSADFAGRYGWRGAASAEDLDFSMRLLRDGYHIAYEPLAISGQYMPPSPSWARSQRARWSAGEADAVWKRLPKHLSQSLVERDVLSALYSLYLASPPFSANLLVCLVAIAASLGLAAMGGPEWPTRLGVSVLSLHAGYLGLALHEVDNRKGYLLAVAMIPVYACWRIWVMVGALRTRSRSSWVRTSRV